MEISDSVKPLRLQKPLRFVHASDLHLDRTIERVDEGPVHWEQRLLDVSRRAALRLFEKVLEEEVDFLVLGGDVLNANIASPGTLLFLLEQFERLAKAGITVFWAGGEFDSPEDWPTAFPFPENVKLFPGNTIQEFYFHRSDDGNEGPLAKIVGMSRNRQARSIRSSEFPLDPGGLYTIAVANGDLNPESVSQRRIDYWALGGKRQRQIFHGNPRKKGVDGKPISLDPPNVATGKQRDRRDLPPPPYVVHYPGATVARSPDDLGQFGATLVEVPWGEEPVLTFFSTSPIRWVNDEIKLDAGDDAAKLADLLRQRVKNYRDAQKSDDLMISWFVDVPPGHLASSLQRGNLSAELLAELRAFFGTDFSSDVPITWSVSLSLLLPDRLPKNFYDQQSILGDFLRSVKHYQDHPNEMIDLESYLPKHWAEEWENLDIANRLLLAEKIKIDPVPDKSGDLVSAMEIDDHSLIRQGSQTFRFVRSKEQEERQYRILREAALVGVELLSDEPQHKLFSLERLEKDRNDDSEK